MRDTGSQNAVGLDHDVNEHVTAGVSLGLSEGDVHSEGVPSFFQGLTDEDLWRLVSSHVAATFAGGFYVSSVMSFQRRNDANWDVDPYSPTLFDNYFLRPHYFSTTLEGATHVSLGVLDVNPLVELIYLNGELDGTTSDGNDPRKTIYHRSFTTASVGGGLRISTRLGRNGSIVPGVAINKAVALENHITADNSLIGSFAVPIDYHVQPRIDAAVQFVISDAVTAGLNCGLQFDDGSSRNTLAASLTWRF